MIRHFDMKRYPRERGKKLHYFGGLLFKEIRYINKKVDLPS